MRHLRAAVAGNLGPLFPAESPRALERRALDTFRAYANDVIDFIRAIDAPGDEIAGLFEVDDDDRRVFMELHGQGRGMLLITGHYGNWEAGGVMMRRVFDLPLTVVAMPEVNEEVNRQRNTIREALGIESIEVRQSLDAPLRIARTLRENGIVAMLMDRYVDRDRVEVRFLGRQVAFLRTPALIGYLTGSPLLPCFMERTGRRTVKVTPGEPIVVARDGARDEAIQIAAQRFADQLAARVTAHPQFWYQFYPYWESQPPSG